MVKKKKTQHWSKQKINNKLFFGVILLILFLYILVAFGTYFKAISWNNIAQNFTVFSFPTLTPKPIYTSPPNTLPTSTIPKLKPSELPDELIVSRAVSTNPFQDHNYPLTHLKTINDPIIVQKLYIAILALPPVPTFPGDEGHCGAHPYLVRYNLTFYKNGGQFKHGVINILVGCGAGESVNLDGTFGRQFYTLNTDEFQTFAALLEKTFGLTGSQLYQMPDPNWLKARGVPQ
jgi:hypothetical protein